MFTAISSHLYRIIPSFLRGKLNREGFILYARNIQWVAIWKIATTVFSLLTTMLVVRLLGPEQFGTLSYVISLSGLFGVIGSLGIGYIVYNEMVNHKDRREEILGSSITLTLITGLVAFLLTVAYLFFFNETPYIKSLTILLALSFFTAPFSYLHIDFLKDKEGRFVAITQTITTIVGGILKVLGVYLFASLYLFIAVLVLENIFAGALYLYQMKYIKKRSANFVVSQARVKEYFFMAIPLTALAGFNEIYYRIDQIILKHMVDITAVGLYASAVRLTELWYVVPNILIASLFPALAHTASDKENPEYKKRFRIFLSILIAVSLLIVLLTVLFGKLFITFVYGQAFTGASFLLSVYILSLPGSFISMLLMQDMFLNNKKWNMVLFSACTAIVNITLCLLLIPKYGPLGAALATAISYNTTPLLYYAKNTIWKLLNTRTG